MSWLVGAILAGILLYALGGTPTDTPLPAPVPTTAANPGYQPGYGCAHPDDTTGVKGRILAVPVDPADHC